MKLSIRLSSIASLISKGDTVYDIGCDHAYLDIFLSLYNGNICYGIEKQDKILKNAYKNVQLYNAKDVNLCVSDGLKDIDIKDNSVCVISGMGTSTILEILEDKKRYKFKYIIVQSNNDYELLRDSLRKFNLKIVDEIVVLEKGKYYITLKLVKGSKRYTKKDLFLGPILRRNPSLETTIYYEYLKSEKFGILNKIPPKHLKQKLKLIKEIKWLNKYTKQRK